MLNSAQFAAIEGTERKKILQNFRIFLPTFRSSIYGSFQGYRM